MALVLCTLLVTGCAHARLNDAHDRLIEKKAAAVSRGCRWLASRQSPDGSLTAPGQHLNVNVWETALASVALLRCDGAAYGGVIAKGFEFLDANWIEAGGLPEAVARRFSPFKSHCIETTSTALRAYAAAGEREQAQKLRDFLFSMQEADGGWKVGYPEARMVFPNGDVLEVFPSVTGSVTSLAIGAVGRAWRTSNARRDIRTIMLSCSRDRVR